MSTQLGNIAERNDIKSSMGPFRVLLDYKVQYPQVVIEALGELFMEYNRAFLPLVEANREWDGDYQYCQTNGSLVNWIVQIDMVGLDDSTLGRLDRMSVAEAREDIRYRVFELENSLAMYQLLERIFANGQPSFFQQNFRQVLQGIRRQVGHPLALLAVTTEKYSAMLQSEFGKQAGEPISDEEVADLSGFDKFFGPKEFQQYLRKNGGRCDYSLYVRSSDPVAKLRNPELSVEHPLLGDSDIRRIIKAHSITFNLDNPAWPSGDRRRINDTKAYMEPLGMGFSVGAGPGELCLVSPELLGHLFAGRGYKEFSGERLSKEFRLWLISRGVNPEEVESGRQHLRAKPRQGTYGCYGHVVGGFPEVSFRGQLWRNLQRYKGGYVIQQEMEIPSIAVPRKEEGNLVMAGFPECPPHYPETRYEFIDRNFFGMLDGRPTFLGGFRDMLPSESSEAKAGRLHGNKDALWAEIIPKQEV